jgi:hypothetical protein
MPKSAQRIYRVSDQECVSVNGAPDRLILATGQAQALKYVIGERFTARAVAAVEVAKLMSEGVVVEDATAVDPTRPAAA